MKNYMRNIALACCAAAFCAVSCSGPSDGRDADAGRKADELLARMTLREKIGQMNQVSGGYGLMDMAAKGEVGSILNCVDPVEINAVQKAAVEQSRLGIPLLVSRDVIHGFRTIFPPMSSHIISVTYYFQSIHYLYLSGIDSDIFKE